MKFKAGDRVVATEDLEISLRSDLALVKKGTYGSVLMVDQDDADPMLQVRWEDEVPRDSSYPDWARNEWWMYEEGIEKVKTLGKNRRMLIVVSEDTEVEVVHVGDQVQINKRIRGIIFDQVVVSETVTDDEAESVRVAYSIDAEDVVFLDTPTDEWRRP
jgi:hypothetical protein